MVWLIAGLPAVAVVASFVSYYIAARDPDSLVKDEFRKEGLAMVAPIVAADQAASALGVAARIVANGTHLEIVLRGKIATAPNRLSLNILHPTREKGDIHILLEHAQGLSYIVKTPDTGSGKRILVLEPEDRAWRITGQWMAPFSGMTELVAKENNLGSNPGRNPGSNHISPP